MQKQEVIQVLKEWIPELELMARYNDDSLSYRRYSAIDEVIKKFKEQRPKGKWIHWTDDYKDYVTCSCCGYGEEGEVLLSNKTPFCPICGADMRGEEE